MLLSNSKGCPSSKENYQHCGRTRGAHHHHHHPYPMPHQKHWPQSEDTHPPENRRMYQMFLFALLQALRGCSTHITVLLWLCI